MSRAGNVVRYASMDVGDTSSNYSNKYGSNESLNTDITVSASGENYSELEIQNKRGNNRDFMVSDGLVVSGSTRHPSHNDIIKKSNKGNNGTEDDLKGREWQQLMRSTTYIAYISYMCMYSIH